MNENPKFMSDISSPDLKEAGFQAPASHGRPRHRGPQHGGLKQSAGKEANATTLTAAPTEAPVAPPPPTPTHPVISEQSRQEITAAETTSKTAVLGQLESLSRQDAPTDPIEANHPVADATSQAQTETPAEPSPLPVLPEDQQTFFDRQVVGTGAYTPEQQARLYSILTSGNLEGNKIRKVYVKDGIVTFQVVKSDNSVTSVPFERGALLEDGEMPPLVLSEERQELFDQQVATGAYTPEQQARLHDILGRGTFEGSEIIRAHTASDGTVVFSTAGPNGYPVMRQFEKGANLPEPETPTLSAEHQTLLDQQVATGAYSPEQQAKLQSILATGEYDGLKIRNVSVDSNGHIKFELISPDGILTSTRTFEDADRVIPTELSPERQAFFAQEIESGKYTPEQQAMLRKYLETGMFGSQKIVDVKIDEGGQLRIITGDGKTLSSNYWDDEKRIAEGLQRRADLEKKANLGGDTPTSSTQEGSTPKPGTEQENPTPQTPEGIPQDQRVYLQQQIASGNYPPDQVALMQQVLASGQIAGMEAIGVTVTGQELHIRARDSEGKTVDLPIHMVTPGAKPEIKPSIELEMSAAGVPMIPESVEGIDFEEHVEEQIRSLQDPEGARRSELDLDRIKQLMSEIDAYPLGRLRDPAVTIELGTLTPEQLKVRLKNRVIARLLPAFGEHTNVASDTDGLGGTLFQMDQLDGIRIAALGEFDPATGTESMERGEYAPQVREAIAFLEQERSEGGVFGQGAYFRMQEYQQDDADIAFIGDPATPDTLAYNSKRRLVEDYFNRGLGLMLPPDIDERAMEHARTSLRIGKDLINCLGQEAKYRGAIWKDVALPGGGTGNRLATEVAWEMAFDGVTMPPALLKVRESADYNRRMRDYHNILFRERLNGNIRYANDATEYLPADGVFGKIIFGPDQSVMRGATAFSSELALLASTRVESYVTHKGFNSLDELMQSQTRNSALRPGAITIGGETVLAPGMPPPPALPALDELRFQEAAGLRAKGDFYRYGLQILKGASGYVDLIASSSGEGLVTNPVDSTKINGDKPDDIGAAIQPYLKVLSGLGYLQRVNGDLYNDTRLLYTKMYFRWLKGEWGLKDGNMTSRRSVEAKNLFGVDNIETIHISRAMTLLTRYFQDGNDKIANDVLDSWGKEDWLPRFLKLMASGGRREGQQGFGKLVGGLARILEFDLLGN